MGRRLITLGRAAGQNKKPKPKKQTPKPNQKSKTNKQTKNPKQPKTKTHCTTTTSI